MLRILETETVSYLAYATARTENFLLGHLYQFALDVLLRRTDNEAAAMLVYRTGQLHLDFLQTVSVNAFFFVGQMKSLIRSIRKEGILLDVLP